MKAPPSPALMDVIENMNWNGAAAGRTMARSTR
jgi:hypothetical protein